MRPSRATDKGGSGSDNCIRSSSTYSDNTPLPSLNDDRQDRLGNLTDAVAKAFETYRDPDELKTISLVIDDSTHGRRTLIVHVDGEDASTLADEVKRFVQEWGATTSREVHSAEDVRVLATID